MRIRPRCFVVMPYGRKPVGRSDAGRSIEVDFDAVYERLLVPALRQAGCTWFRSSEETTSADIRTGMFYELATSDFVLSDISILNANVFYELGIRHGLSSRGSILVHGGWVDQPIDIAVDRAFGTAGSFSRQSGTNRRFSRKFKRRLNRKFSASPPLLPGLCIPTPGVSVALCTRSFVASYRLTPPGLTSRASVTQIGGTANGLRRSARPRGRERRPTS
jgi:hypothetical protein